MAFWNKKKENNDFSETKTDTSGYSFIDYLMGGLQSGGSNISAGVAYWLWENIDALGNATDRISWAFQQIKPVLRDKKTGEYLISESDHPLLKLLNNTNSPVAAEQLKFELMTAYLITGEAFPIAKGFVKSEPVSLYHIKPNSTNIFKGADDWIQNISFTKHDSRMHDRVVEKKRGMWVYQTHDKLSETIQVLNVVERDGVRGMSVVNRVFQQAYLKYTGNEHNVSILKNGSRPSSMWSPSGSEAMSDSNFKTLKKAITEHYTGATKAGKSFLSQTPLNLQNMMLNTRDMDFINLIKESEKDIYNQYNIPLPLVSTETMTMSNFKNAIDAFYDLAVLPRASFVWSTIGRWLLPRYKDGDRYELVIDERQISVLKDRLIARSNEMSKTYVYSDNEIRTAAGYESNDGGDVIYKPANMIVAGFDDYNDDNVKR